MKSRLLSVAVASAAVALFSVGARASVPQAEAPRLARISLELQNADLRNVIAVIAETSRLNFIVDEEVGGRVTLRLRNVTWREALDALLASRGLGVEQVGTIVRVAPSAKLTEEARMKASAARHLRESAPLRTTIIPVSYARAADLVAHVKATLSERGSVTFDQRTNVLIVRDIVQ
jgi:type IV pilus assembly protein PilQ